MTTAVARPTGSSGASRGTTIPDRPATPSRPDRAAAGPQPTIALTGRGAGALAVFAVLVVVSLATRSLGLIPLLVALGVAFLVAPGMAWARGRHALAPPAAHVLLHAVPATVPVGGTCTLQILAATAPDRKLPPLRLDRPDGRWRLTHRLPHGPDGWAPAPATWVRPRRRLAPGPLAVLPLAPAGPNPPAATGEPAASASVAVPSGRRGILQLPALLAWVHDPLGFFAVAVAATPPLAVVVHPRPAPPPAGDTVASGSAVASREVGTVAQPWWAAGGCGDFTDLRPYVAGDRLHLVDWPALARYDRLLVRRFEPETVAAVHVVLDDRVGVHRRTAFERLLSTLVGMVEISVTRGRPVEVSTVSGLRFTVPPTPEGLAKFLPVVATLDPRRTPAGAGPGPAAPSPGTVGRLTLLTTATGAERLRDPWLHGAQVVVAG